MATFTMRHAHLFIAAIIFTIVSVWITSNPLVGVFDSLTHWGAIQLFVQGGDPYDFDALREVLSKRMNQVPSSQRIGGHPWTLTFMLPIYVWPFPVAKFLLAFTSLSLYYLSILRLKKLWPPLPRYAPLLMWGYIPLLATLYFGQFSVFLLVGAVLLVEWIESPNRPWWKWALAMALLSIKPQGFIVAAPFIIREFVRTASPRDVARTVGFFLLLAPLSTPLLVYLPEWLTSNRFSHHLRTATLSTYVRDCGALLGYDSPLWLWALPLASVVFIVVTRVRVIDSSSLLLVLAISQVTAPYLWIYDACALMPLFYALIGAAYIMHEPRWRRFIGIIFTSIAIFPVYLAIDSDFSFMVMHNVFLTIAAVFLLPGLRGYLRR